jgi:serine/threonine-protein kinase
MADIVETLQASLEGRYKVERELGRGGMATVYFAHDLINDRDVAIKVLHPDLAATIGADRFSREITLASRLNHPHILGFYESGTADKLLYYVMPFVKGESVRDRLNREGQIPVQDAVRIITEVASALGFAHEQGIVHRDVKPENILLLENGHALVADFGIARAATEGDAQKLTQTGMAVGTPVYMSPEQSTGEKVGPAADIYSLGCVLYEMLSGEPPFTGKNAMAIMARHAMDTVPSIRIVRNAVPEEVEEAIYAAMEKAPVDRPKTAADFIEILGTPMGETAMRRVTRMTQMRRIPTPIPEPPKVPLWKKPAFIGGLLLLVAGGGAAWKFTQGNGGGDTSAKARRVAVLYFDNDTKDPELAYVADGITDGVIASLSGVTGLSVVSRGGAEQFRGSELPADSIARVLDVGILVRGNVEKTGDKLRVSLRLIDGESGTDIKRESVGPFAGTQLALRDSVAAQVAQLIRERVGTEIKVREQRDATRNEQAWTLVQRAEASRKRAMSTGGRGPAADSAFNLADSLLAAAAPLDTRWPEPMSQRAMIAYRRAVNSVSDLTVAKVFVDSGLVWAEQSLTRAAGNPGGLEARGSLRYFQGLTLEPDETRKQAVIAEAKSDLEAAVAANPQQASAWATLSHLYNNSGDKLDVNRAAKRALEADAFLENAEVVYYRLFTSSYDLGKFTPDAERYCDEIVRRFPGKANAMKCQLLLLTTKAKTPDVPKAWALADSIVQRSPAARQPVERLVQDMFVAAVLARANLADSARKVVQRSKGDEQLDPTRDLMQRSAFVYTLLGDTTAAVAALKVFLASHENLRSELAEDPGWWFRPIANSAEFRKLVGGP